MNVGVSLGVSHYIESAVPPYFYFESPSDPKPFLTRGAWMAIEGSYMLWPWVAVAGRARFGWLRRGPPNAASPGLVPGGDIGMFDPQRGDGPFGGSAGVIVRFLPKKTALDVGLTASFGSFRPRFEGQPSVPYDDEHTCGDCAYGQHGFSTEEVWPTIRVSSTGPGFFYAVGTGESFVRTYEPGIFELLFGYRGDDVEFRGGFARGLALRLDVRVEAEDWVSVDWNVDPIKHDLPGYPSPKSIFSMSFTRRYSQLAPL